VAVRDPRGAVDAYRIRWDDAAIRDLADDVDAGDMVVDIARAMSRDSAVLAPKRTGRGARSIREWPGRDAGGHFADVSWSQERFYMSFPEFGTSRQRREPFIKPVFDRYIHL
jgi:HK97 gp10 family phage protein